MGVKQKTLSYCQISLQVFAFELSPQLKALFRKAMEPLRDGTSLEKVGFWVWT